MSGIDADAGRDSGEATERPTADAGADRRNADASVAHHTLELTGEDGHRWQLISRIPERPRARLLWLPALGIAARHYIPWADALAAQGIAVGLHEWRGHGSSHLRAGHDCDWGYRALLLRDIPASEAALTRAAPGVPCILGGHSLGGQLACIRAGLAPAQVPRIWLVGSGAPYWPAFPAPLRWGLPLLYRFLPWLARRAGKLPGRRIGFGGNEARGLIVDWARTGLSGRYAVADIEADIDAAMALARPRIEAAVLDRDWMAPAGSTRYLLSRLPRAEAHLHVIDAAQLGTEADHYAWMREPAGIARVMLATLD